MKVRRGDDSPSLASHVIIARCQSQPFFTASGGQIRKKKEENESTVEDCGKPIFFSWWAFNHPWEEEESVDPQPRGYFLLSPFPLIGDDNEV